MEKQTNANVHDGLRAAKISFGLAIFSFVLSVFAMILIRGKFGQVPFLGDKIVFDGIWAIDVSLPLPDFILIAFACINFAAAIFLLSALICHVIYEKETRAGLLGFLIFIFAVLAFGFFSGLALGLISSLCSALILGFITLLFLKKESDIQIFGGLCVGGVFAFGACFRLGFGLAFLSTDLIFLLVFLSSKLPQVKGEK